MLFRRREPEGVWTRFRTALWPRRSFARSVQYLVKRVLRLTATPHAIAAGVAAGVFASWMPFLGFHFVIAAALAFVLAGNLFASAIGTAIGNPITFPFIWAITHKLGTFLLGGRDHPRNRDINLLEHFRHTDFWHFGEVWDLFLRLWQPFLKPMFVGGIPFGLVCASIFYGLTYWGVKTFQNRRRLALAGKAAR
ncbi:MAG: DUF2062 domain-containing protein [Rhizobiaceae bacterium]|nr:DUF2062 domain-containing protein [Rhizobiaceae bacterium]